MAGAYGNNDSDNGAVNNNNVRVSIPDDNYPTYGGTPRGGLGSWAATPIRDGLEMETPRRSSASVAAVANMAMRALKLGTAPGRLSDADDLQQHYNNYYYEEARLSVASAASPFSMAMAGGPAPIPDSSEHRLSRSDVESGIRAHSSAAVADDYFEVDVGKPVNDSHPPLHINLKFNDVKYKVTLKDGSKWRGKDAVEKEILHGITGNVLCGEMLALMGPSGSGKTTFLNLLGGRKSNPQNVSGEILYNELPYNKNLKRRMGFVTQDDVLFPHLTVRETLTFSALLRLPQHLTRQQKIDRAEDVMVQLGLQKCSDTVIGNQFLRGVSGGERKRVCIGQEILIDPSIIFLDEPTSGLDSTTALRLIKLLQNIAHEGRTVLTTIHQPSSRAFHMFDKLLLLSEGHTVYFGKARGAMTYFDSIGFAPLIPMNPADFLLDLCCGTTTDISLPTNLKVPKTPTKSNDVVSVPQTPLTLLAKDVKKYLVECCDAQISSTEIFKQNEEKKRQQTMKKVVEMDSTNYGHQQRMWGASWWEQFIILLVRGFKERKHEHLGFLRVLQVVASALLAGCLWWKSKHNTPQQVQDQVGLMFFIAVFWSYLPLFSALFTFPIERAMLAKERASDMYRLSAYFMARTLGDLPLDLALPFVFMTILYFMADLERTFLAFFLTILTVFLTVITAKGFGFLVGAAMMDVQKATTFSSIAILAFMLAGGFFVRYIPPFVEWLKYFSFQAHTYNMLIQIQYANVNTYNCASDTGCQSIATSPSLHNTPLHGGLTSSLAMLAMVFGYRVLAYIALRRMRTTA